VWDFFSRLREYKSRIITRIPPIINQVLPQEAAAAGP